MLAFRVYQRLRPIVHTDCVVCVTISVLQRLASGQCFDVRKPVSDISSREHTMCGLMECVGGLRLIIAAISSGGYHRVVAWAVVSRADVLIALVLPVRVGEHLATAVATLVGAVRGASPARRR